MKESVGAILFSNIGSKLRHLAKNTTEKQIPNIVIESLNSIQVHVYGSITKSYGNYSVVISTAISRLHGSIRLDLS